VRLVSGIEHHLAGDLDGLGFAGMDHGGVSKAMPEWRCTSLYDWKDCW
jgi:hypothetical protein